jgi:hypothetical protein
MDIGEFRIGEDISFNFKISESGQGEAIPMPTTLLAAATSPAVTGHAEREDI